MGVAMLDRIPGVALSALPFLLPTGWAFGSDLGESAASRPALIESSVGLGDRSWEGVQPEDAAAEAPADGDEAIDYENLSERVSFFKGWTTTVGLGLNGSSGNTESLDVRFSWDSERVTNYMETYFNLLYSGGTEEGEVNENYFRTRIRNDWLVPDSRWRYFAIGQLEFDEEQDWNWRIFANAGVGYDFVQTEKMTLTGRAGLGVLQDLGGTDEDFRFEGLLAVDFVYRFNEKHKVFFTGEYYPAFDPWPVYRLYGRAGWEVLIDPELNLSLRVGLEDRYDSSPGSDAQRNDLDYFIQLALTF